MRIAGIDSGKQRDSFAFVGIEIKNDDPSNWTMEGISLTDDQQNPHKFKRINRSLYYFFKFVLSFLDI